MDWSNIISEYEHKIARPIEINLALKQKIYQLLDLTNLNEDETPENIEALAADAQGPLGHVACICVQRPYLAMIASQFNHKIKTATVANFPSGISAIEDVLIEIDQALQAGAQEIDVVFPYSRFLSGDKEYAFVFVESCKAACGTKAKLKIILETAALGKPEVIAEASRIAIDAGTDFIKTSTGKHTQGGATSSAAIVMLNVIKEKNAQTGFKAAGGIRTVAEAAQFLAIGDAVMGHAYVNPKTFRIGASHLVKELLQAI